jgi:hypothetical protein
MLRIGKTVVIPEVAVKRHAVVRYVQMRGTTIATCIRGVVRNRRVKGALMRGIIGLGVGIVVGGSIVQVMGGHDSMVAVIVGVLVGAGIAWAIGRDR